MPHKNLLLRSAQCGIFQLAVKNAFNHIIITDADGKIVYANSAVERITGYTTEEVIGKTPRLWGGQMSLAFYKKMWHRIKVEQKPFEGEISNVRKNGTPYIAHSIVSPVLDDKGALIGFIGTEEDVTKQKELESMSSEFISITAHQLKTPLTGMKWHLELLKDETKKNKQAQRSVTDITNATEELISLVDRLLNISRIESGRISFKPERVDAAELLEKIANDMADQFEKSQHIINLRLQHISFETDPAFLREIIVNLMSNAEKYTPDNGSIDLSLEKKDKHIVIRVADTGQGIPKADQKNIFKKYFRAQNVRKNSNGSGLGLYFVKELVNICQATISFESVEGKGTTFTVSFPIKKPRARKGAVSLSESQIR
jgi:two-component system phosphate regulon sensor histidine kinase PhoR